MQTAQERARLVGAYASELTGACDTMYRAALGLAALCVVALVGAAVDPHDARIAERWAADKGRLEIEQASLADRKDVYRARRARYEVVDAPVRAERTTFDAHASEHGQR